jgi:hypothetical protein
MGALGRIVDVLDHRLALPLKLLTCLDAGRLNERASVYKALTSYFPGGPLAESAILR